ncbi:MAG: FMN-binding protein [Gemmiger sp.]
MDKKESTFQSIISPVIVLVAICVVCSAILAALNGVTAPIVEENEHKATLEAYVAVLPDGTSVDDLTDLAVTTAGVSGAVKTPDGSVAVKAAAAGYSGKDVTVYVAFGTDGMISGIQVDASTQTAGIGSKVAEDDFTTGFLGWDAAGQVTPGSPVDTLSGATYSSKAVFSALNSAIDCYNNEIKGVA